jgi:acrylyl-CoA reductase (NADPH)
MFRALVTRRGADGAIGSAVETLSDEALPAGGVLVGIEWSGLNYKDALCLTGRGGLVRAYPHIAGIDFAGRVLDSADERYRPGQPVVLTGWHVGERHWGGFAERARVSADWLVPLPRGLSTRDAMVIGTAGFTAMLAANRLKSDGLRPEQGEVLVTGAGGGVGSIAVLLMSRLGHRVVAVTGRAELAERLTELGAAAVLGRDQVVTQSGKPLDHEQWAGAIDTVGGPMLADVLKKVKRDGAVAALGNAGGVSFEGNVLPFILRGVTLFGIDSVVQPHAARVAAWDRLATLFAPGAYAPWVTEISLGALPEAAARILKGGVAGRVIVNPRRE